MRMVFGMIGLDLVRAQMYTEAGHDVVASGRSSSGTILVEKHIVAEFGGELDVRAGHALHVEEVREWGLLEILT